MSLVTCLSEFISPWKHYKIKFALFIYQINEEHIHFALLICQAVKFLPLSILFDPSKKESKKPSSIIINS